MNGPKSVIAMPVIETRRELYDTYLDYEWVETFSVPSRIEEAFDSFWMAWKEDSNTHRLPYLVVEQMEAFANEYMRARLPKGRRMIRYGVILGINLYPDKVSTDCTGDLTLVGDRFGPSPARSLDVSNRRSRHRSRDRVHCLGSCSAPGAAQHGVVRTRIPITKFFRSDP